MFVKALEVHGFKSFAQKSRLEFSNGINVIVGPNGSGKSNLVDAVRWVLGEQSLKSLRANRLEDLVFGGGEGHRPMGMAEVSIIFDNADGGLDLAYQEVMLTRRYFRSGEGEYFLNRSSVRLRDGQALFWDTGVGKVGPAIISQGRVDDVLQARGEERRAMVEEAAGITKYRFRKQETLARLQETSIHLERLSDLMIELSAQGESLEAESKRAVERRRLVSRRDELVASLRSLEVARLRSEIQAVEKALVDLQSREESSGNRRREIEKEIIKKREALVENDEAISRNDQDLQVLGDNLTATEANLRRLGEEAVRLKAEEEHLARTCKTLEVERQKTLAILDNLSETIAVTGTSLEDAAERYAKGSAGLGLLREELSSFEKAREERRGTLAILEEEQFALRQELQMKVSEGRAANQELQGIEASINRLSDAVAQARDEKERLALRRAELAEVCRRLVGKKHRLTVAGNTHRRAMAEVEKQLTPAEQELFAMKSRLRSLEELAASAEGYRAGTRAVLLEKGRWPGIYGAVGDVINVAPGYEAAIEAALGGSEHFLVVATASEAQRVVEFLKLRRAGRATFIPLDLVRSRSFPDNINRALHGNPGVVGCAAELVATEPELIVLKGYLLGNVLVVENLKRAIELARGTARGLKVVTVDGEVIASTGAITGGASSKRSTGPLLRSQERQRLREQVPIQDVLVREMRGRYEKHRSGVEKVSQRLDILTGSWFKATGELKRVARDYRECFRRSQENEESLRDFASRSTTVTARVDALKTEEVSLLARLALIQPELSALRSHEETSAGEAACRQQELSRLIEEVATARAERAAQGERLEEVKRQAEEFKRSLDSNRLEAESAVPLHDSLCRRRQLAEIDLMELEERARGLREDIQSQKRKIEEPKIERRRLQQKLGSLERERDGMAFQTRELREARHALEVDKAGLLSQLKGLSAGEDEFGQNLLAGIMSAEEMEKELEDTTRGLDALGLVNLLAEDEYIRWAERNRFLEEQRSDLEKARLSLEEALQHLDEVISREFNKALDALGEAFNHTFNRLFGGGKACLLETQGGGGVDITVQLPGRRMQPMALLSGGERALTAIAFLFAFLHVKPSPFCLLDEIDASLDDANIRRFSDYLRELAHKTQFIVVSHRQGTMEAAENLFGVTSEGGGVSRLIAVRLGTRERSA